jgi:Fur family ferric uptake transcriptional regulator
MSYQTRQREAVLRVLAGEGRPLSAQSVFELAKTYCPGIGAATVFRTLKQAIEAGEIAKVELPGLPPHYEISSGKHHHFFVCESCHQLLPLEGCVSGLQKLLPSGSRMKNHEVVIFGECPECVAE